jgi:sialic acid synthase SpsE
VKTIRIAERLMGEGQPSNIIAEAGVNHHGDLDLTGRLVAHRASARAGVVRFQTRSVDAILIQVALEVPYLTEGFPGAMCGDHRRCLELFQEAYGTRIAAETARRCPPLPAG